MKEPITRVGPAIVSDELMPALAKGMTPRLYVLVGASPCRKYVMRDTITIGRSEECEVRLDDPKISRQHLRIEPRGENWYVVDLGSRNGTLVNGEKTTERRLRFGDRVQLGSGVLLLFTPEDPLEDLLMHRQQMELVGRLAAGITHDFNNLLNVMMASATNLEALLVSEVSERREVRECLEDIRTAAMRGAELTQRVLSMGRYESEPPEGPSSVDVSAICVDVVRLVERTFERGVRVQTRVDPQLHVIGDRAELHQALMNLCVNARDAMPNGGTLKVTARADHSRPRLGNDPDVLITVSDTGEGMTDAVKERLFEPFFTTKERGAGSGLGLTTVKQVVVDHGGTIDVRSRVDEGTTFEVWFPGTQTPVAKRVDARVRRPMATVARPLRILVADDQELVRRSLGRLLAAQGHEILFAGDGVEVLSTLETEGLPDLVILDLDMPRMTGDECLRHVKEKYPDLPVVLLSGYAEAADRDALFMAGAAKVLSKPIEANDLKVALASAMRGA